MRKSYLFVYSDDLGTREQVKDCVDSLREVIHWKYDMPNCFYLISENSAVRLAELIRGVLGNHRFLITEIKGDNKQGWLPQSTWDLINKKRR